MCFSPLDSATALSQRLLARYLPSPSENFAVVFLRCTLNETENITRSHTMLSVFT